MGSVKGDVSYALLDRKTKTEAPEMPASKLLCPEWRGPAMVIDCATLRVEYANRNCLDLLSREFALKVQNGLLSFGHCHERKSFQANLQAAKTTGQRSTAWTLRCAAEGSWALAVVRFLDDEEAQAVCRTTANGDGMVEPAVIEFTECGYVPDRECFRAISETLRLSPSESRDLIAIATGYTADEIAVSSNVAISTIRQRIKSLLAKAECSRQQDLTCLVRSLCPAEHETAKAWTETQFGITANCARPHVIAAE